MLSLDKVYGNATDVSLTLEMTITVYDTNRT